MAVSSALLEELCDFGIHIPVFVQSYFHLRDTCSFIACNPDGTGVRLCGWGRLYSSLSFFELSLLLAS